LPYCLADARWHSALIDMSSYPDEVEVPCFGPRVKCGKRGVRAAVKSPVGGQLMTKKAKHKDKKQESKKDRARDKDDRATPRDDDRDRTVPDDQKHEKAC